MSSQLASPLGAGPSGCHREVACYGGLLKCVSITKGLYSVTTGCLTEVTTKCKLYFCVGVLSCADGAVCEDR